MKPIKDFVQSNKLGIGISSLAILTCFIGYKFYQKKRIKEVENKVKHCFAKIIVHPGEPQQRVSAGFFVDTDSQHLLLAPFHLFGPALMDEEQYSTDSVSHTQASALLDNKVKTCCVNDSVEGKAQYNKALENADIMLVSIKDIALPLNQKLVNTKFKMLGDLEIKKNETLYFGGYSGSSVKFNFKIGSIHTLIKISAYCQIGIIDAEITPGYSGSPVFIKRQEEIYLVGMIYSSGPGKKQGRALILTDFNDLFDLDKQLFIDIPLEHRDPELLTMMSGARDKARAKRRTVSDTNMGVFTPPSSQLQSNGEIKLSSPMQPELALMYERDDLPLNMTGIVIHKGRDQTQRAIVFKVFTVIDGKRTSQHTFIQLNQEIMKSLSQEAKELLRSKFTELNRGDKLIVPRTPATGAKIDEITALLAAELGFTFPELTKKISIFLEGFEQAKHSSDYTARFGEIGRDRHHSQFVLSIDSIMYIAMRAYNRLFNSQPTLYDPAASQFDPLTNKKHIWVLLEHNVGNSTFPKPGGPTNCIKFQTTFLDRHILYHAYPDNNWATANGWRFNISELLDQDERLEKIKMIEESKVTGFKLTF